MNNIFDLLLTDDLDLSIEGGDFVLSESTAQHQRLLLETEPGDWRESPGVGVGIRSMLLDDAPGGTILAEVQEQFENDGLRIAALTITDEGQLQVQAAYPPDA